MNGIAMDSSTSINDSPKPEITELTTVSEQVAAIDRLLAIAKNNVRVFDQDLSQTGWGAATRIDAVAAFLRGMSGRRCDIIVHDTRYIESSCPRLLSLVRRYGHAMSIYRTGPEARLATDPLIIVDRRHYLHRFHYDQSRSALGIESPEEAQLLSNRFDEIWATGEVALTGTVLGL
jgi:hypothetical protein